MTFRVRAPLNASVGRPNLLSRVSMQSLPDRRSVWLAMAFLFCLYFAFVVLTPASSYGLTLEPDGHSTWATIRVLTFSLWLVLAAWLVGARRSLITWRSFAYAFLGSSTLALAIASSVGSAASDMSVAGTIVMYALVSGFLCITVIRPPLALILGTLLFLAQLLLDVTGHFLSGQFRLH